MLASAVNWGVGIPHQLPDHTPYLDALRPAVWYDWLYSHAGEPGYLPMLFGLTRDTQRRQDNFEAAIEAANAHPEILWLLGNELEYTQEGNTTPEQAAETVRLWRERTTNPIALPGCHVQTWTTPLWEQWLDAYLAAGGIIGDFWHIHIYAGGGAHWRAEYRVFVDWMERNRVVRPVIVSETSAVSNPLDVQVEVMQTAHQALSSMPHCEAVLWFCAYLHREGDPYKGGDLLTADAKLTELGREWMRLQQVDVGVAEDGHTVFLPGVDA